jgi:hypothetical protein
MEPSLRDILAEPKFFAATTVSTIDLIVTTENSVDITVSSELKIDQSIGKNRQTQGPMEVISLVDNNNN